MNCATTPANITENNVQNLNGEYPGDIYVDKRQRFSIFIPKSGETSDWKINYEDAASDALLFVGLMYNVESSVFLVHANTSLSISEFVDDAIVEAGKLKSLVGEPQRGNISIGTTDLQLNHVGNVGIITTDLQAQYIKTLVYREDGRILFRKFYFIPHRIGNAVMMITCAAILPDDDDTDLDVLFDKFVKTFNWIS